MERQRPDTSSDEIDLYIRTYYSLLRSSGEVRRASSRTRNCGGEREDDERLSRWRDA